MAFKIGDKVYVKGLPHEATVTRVWYVDTGDGETSVSDVQVNHSFTWHPIADVERASARRCECGGSSLKHPSHSHWCAAHESGGTPPFKFDPTKRLF